MIPGVLEHLGVELSLGVVHLVVDLEPKFCSLHSGSLHSFACGYLVPAPLVNKNKKTLFSLCCAVLASQLLFVAVMRHHDYANL